LNNVLTDDTWVCGSFVGPEAFLTPHASQAPAPSALLVGKPITVPSVFSFLRTLNLSSMQRLGDDDLITIARQTGYRLREVRPTSKASIFQMRKRG
jgi:hypothetical protein